MKSVQLTRDYKETVVARVKHDHKLARALYGETMSALLEGETAEGFFMLRDLVHAEVTFKELARQTGLEHAHRGEGRGDLCAVKGEM